MSVQLYVVAGGLTVAALAGGATGLLAQDARNRRLQSRIADRVTPLAAARPPVPSLFDRIAASPSLRDWAGNLAAVCGYKLDRQDAYPLRLPFLLLIVAVPAVVVDRLLSGVAGRSLDLLLPVFWIGCSQVLFRELHARHANKLYKQFPDVLAMIVRSVRAGIPLNESLRVVARESLEPTARQFTRVCDQLAIGIRLDEALRDASARTGVSEYAFFTVALTLQAQTGGSLAETLENLADVIRKRVGLRMRAVALASEARTSAYVLAALPIVTGLALAVLNYEYIRPLFDTKSGNHVLYTAIGMLGTAGLVMRTLIKRSLR